MRDSSSLVTLVRAPEAANIFSENSDTICDTLIVRTTTYVNQAQRMDERSRSSSRMINNVAVNSPIERVRLGQETYK